MTCSMRNRHIKSTLEHPIKSDLLGADTNRNGFNSRRGDTFCPGNDRTRASCLHRWKISNTWFWLQKTQQRISRASWKCQIVSSFFQNNFNSSLTLKTSFMFIQSYSKAWDVRRYMPKQEKCYCKNMTQWQFNLTS